MRLLMFYSPSFWFRTYKKVLEDVDDQSLEETAKEAIVVFYQSEAEDVEKAGKVLTKLIKNVKWLSGKFNTKSIVLHSFGHLSLSKAPPEFASKLIKDAIERLGSSGYHVIETPFGYLNEWKLHVAGESLAKVYKEF